MAEVPSVDSIAPDFTLPTTAGGEVTLSALPISVDSVPPLKAFKAKEQMTVDLLSDFKRQVSRAYGTLNEERFYSNRAYILTDATGVVRWTHVETKSGERRSNEELLAQVKAAA